MEAVSQYGAGWMALKNTERTYGGAYLWLGPVSGLVCILLLALLVGFLYQAKQRAVALYSHTLKVSQKLAKTTSHLSDIDTGLRGYLLTGDEAFLSPYLEGIQTLPSDIRELEQLVSENPAQLGRIHELDGKAQEWLQRMEAWRRTIGQSRGSAEKWEFLQQERDAIYGLLQEMNAAENALLSQRTQNETWAFQSMRIVWRLHEFQNLVISMEKNQRGYLLYGSESFLRDLEKAESQAGVLEGYLTAIMVPYPGLSKEFSSSVGLLNRWKKEACLPEIEAKKGGKNVQQLLRAGPGKGLMEDLRASLERLEGGALLEFEAAEARQNHETSVHRRLVLGLVLAAVLLIASTTWHSLRLHRRQVRKIWRMRKEIEAREKQFLSFMDNSPALAFIKDQEGRYQFINKTFETMFRIKLEGFSGKTDHDFFNKAVADLNRENDRKVLEQDRCLDFYIQIPTPDGKVHDWQVYKFPFRDEHGRRFIGGMTHDITEKKHSEHLMELERQRLLVTLTSIGDGVISTDMEGKVMLVNRVAEQLTGWSQAEAMGKPLGKIFNIVNELTGEPVENPVLRVIQTGVIMGLANHTLLIAKDGTQRPIADSAAPIMDGKDKVIGVVLVFRNVEDEKKHEKERIRAEKMESVGLLAGGIAHDFNNILTILMGNMSLARILVEGDEEASGRLRDAEQAALRARDLAQQLLTFSKGGAPVRQTASIGDLIRDTSIFFLRGSHTRCELEVEPDLWAAEIDSSQISQVVENLILNAEQSMPDGGRVLIRCCNKSRAELGNLPGLPEKPLWVAVSIQDQGVGIRPEHLERIFEPYFTTKQKGSGLGLTTVYSIIKNHEGHITVDSKPGAGTTVHLYLPASENKPVTAVRESVSEQKHFPCPILVMEDDPMIQKLVARLLEPLGYNVSTVSDGSEAIRVYADSMHTDKAFQVVIMDLTIPGGMGGKEAIRELQKLDPAVAAIVSSGYANDPIMANYREFGFSAVVSKPYTAEQLRSVVAEIVSRKQS